MDSMQPSINVANETTYFKSVCYLNKDPLYTFINGNSDLQVSPEVPLFPLHKNGSSTVGKIFLSLDPDACELHFRPKGKRGVANAQEAVLTDTRRLLKSRRRRAYGNGQCGSKFASRAEM